MDSPSPPLELNRLRGCTNFKLRQLARRVSRLYDEELAKCGLKTTQYSLLSTVLRLGPIRPGDLARTMAMDASTLTRNLKPLISGGWVLLGAGEDGRSRLVSITDEGREKRIDAQRHWRVAQESLNELLGTDRIGVLHQLIDESMTQLDTREDGEQQ